MFHHSPLCLANRDDGATRDINDVVGDILVLGDRVLQ
jgi:hypothetical protein